MKFTLQKTSWLAIVCLLINSSCKQMFDYIPEMKTFSQTANKYQINKIEFSINDQNYWGSERVTYFNTKGEPSKTTAKYPSTGNSHQAFVYNSKGYLTQLITHFGDTPSPVDLSSQAGNNNFVVHLYTNNNWGKIVVDSFFYAGGAPVHEPDLGSYLQTVTKYYYDSFSRIIRKESTFIPTFGGSPNPTDVTTYTYGANGNLLGNIYDNRLSVNRLSNVLMFINEDYSMNNKLNNGPYNPDNSYAYNSHGMASTILGFSLLAYETMMPGASYISYIKK